MSDRCRSCKAEIRWVTMFASGKANPLDLEPSPVGNVAIRKDTGLGVTLNRERADALRQAGAALYLSHFATCPDRQEWRDRQLSLEASA